MKDIDSVELRQSQTPAELRHQTTVELGESHTACGAVVSSVAPRKSKKQRQGLEVASCSKKTEVKKVMPIIQVSSTENTTCSSRTGKEDEQSSEIKATNSYIRKESGTQGQTQLLEIKRLSADVSPPKPISRPHAATNKVFVFSSRLSRRDSLKSRSPTPFPAKVRANQVSQRPEPQTKIEPSYSPSSSSREPTACPNNSSASRHPGCLSLSSRTRHPGRIRACLD